jgi:hypothetical protein
MTLWLLLRGMLSTDPYRVSYALIKNFIFRQEIALVVGVEGNRRGVTELDAIRGIR